MMQPWKVSDGGAYARERPGFSHDDILHFTQGSYGMEGQVTNRTVPESLARKPYRNLPSPKKEIVNKINDKLIDYGVQYIFER